MADERAKRAAKAIYVAMDNGTVCLPWPTNAADLIAAEYADVLAENERLKALAPSEERDPNSYAGWKIVAQYPDGSWLVDGPSGERRRLSIEAHRIAALEQQVAELRAALVRVHYQEEHLYSTNEIQEVIEAAIGPIVYEKP